MSTRRGLGWSSSTGGRRRSCSRGWSPGPAGGGSPAGSGTPPTCTAARHARWRPARRSRSQRFSEVACTRSWMVIQSEYILSRNFIAKESALKCEGSKYEAGSFVQDHKVKSNSWGYCSVNDEFSVHIQTYNMKFPTQMNGVPAAGPPAALEGVLQDELRHLRRLAGARVARYEGHLYAGKCLSCSMAAFMREVPSTMNF